MEDFVVIIVYDDGSKGVDGYYKSAKSAIRFAKRSNACKYLHYHYKVFQLSIKKYIY